MDSYSRPGIAFQNEFISITLLKQYVRWLLRELFPRIRSWCIFGVSIRPLRVAPELAIDRSAGTRLLGHTNFSPVWMQTMYQFLATPNIFPYNFVYTFSCLCKEYCFTPSTIKRISRGKIVCRQKRERQVVWLPERGAPRLANKTPYFFFTRCLH